ESAFAKLDVLPPGKTDVLTFERAPHRVFLRLAPGDGSVDAWVAEAYRAKLPVATRRLGPGEQLEFDGLRFGIVGETPTATLAFVHDAGIPLAVAAALAAGLGVLASRWRGDRSVLPAGEGTRDDRA
ncbi:MAG TPA: hypothetical protein VLT61_16280, partial [Anaeromyxobacteraceae bacterium]|nr:hypothetical protein [Anaeromyxobacteraceae bacterium]